ncbi:RHS repeat-associated core domain-containing protein [Bordetella bronchialis]|uniref:RHS repeat-associated core domain-containing protein n=1 Tax=Bordetella bronchialis TaxID=463025 RepID=A0A193G364_9BORD|nr:RHS repeat-associated core domain-containing protein [Bordetella bronchialis]ANN73891.1 hypothetical protein BAU08_23320 [Bordetella bronchialis]
MANVRPLGYGGEFQDPASATYPLGHGYRRFLPTLMRFNAPDDDSPFAEGGLNTYAYCAGDPVNRSDPGGHAPIGAMERAALDAARLAGVDMEDVHPAGLSGPLAVADGLQDQAVRHRVAARFQKAWRNWRQRMGGGRREDVQHIRSTLLPRMGATPVESLDQFQELIARGRVVIEAAGTVGTLREGHSTLYFSGRAYEMDLLAERGPEDRAIRQPLGYEAKFTVRRGRWPKRAYISRNKPLQILLDVGRYRAPIELAIEQGLTFVLDEKYSQHFDLALRQEGFTFSHLPYAYGWYYNCHTFVRGVLERMLDLAE